MSSEYTRRDSRLDYEVEGSGPRVALVHGFTQTRRCWGPLGADLAADHEVVLIDAPGHGGSSQVRADLVEGGLLIGEAGGEATYLGYSMGGRFALHTALERPDLVRGLVLVGATAGLEDAADREARVADDEARARRIEEIGIEAFLDDWMRLPLFAVLPPEAAGRESRLTNTVEGLASSLRLAGTGTQQPTWGRLGELSMPVLVLAGALDLKFVALGERMAAAIGANASFSTVPGAGHTAHLERPAEFLTLLRPWLSAHGL